MSTTREWAVDALLTVDLGRVYGSLAVGLRDGALLALLASGLSCADVAALDCDQVTLLAKTSQARILARRPPWRCELLLGSQHSAYLVAWLSEIRGYNERRPLFVDEGGQRLTRGGVSAILARYKARRAA